MLIEIKHRDTGDVIFSHDCENNTFAKTVELAVKNKVSLSNADLCGADLSNANMNNANMRYANLIGANMNNANMRYANMIGTNMSGVNMSGADVSYARMSSAKLIGTNMSNVNLTGANMSYANMRDADMRNANLDGTIGNKVNIKSLQLEKYPIIYTAEVLQIGCKQFSIAEWKSFDDEFISKLEDDALVWWRKYKELIFQIIELSPAEPTRQDNKDVIFIKKV